MTKLPATLRALEYRNFQLFFSGQLISLIGTWMQNIAQAWLVYRLTGSSVLLGAVSFAGQIPIFFLAPLGGIVADRRSRRRIVIGTQTASMLLAFALGRPHAHQNGARLAYFRAGGVAGCGERFRHPGAPVVSEWRWWARPT